MKKEIILSISILFLLLMVPAALASEITIKGNPFHNIYVQVADGETLLTTHSVPKTDVTGETTFEFDTHLEKISFFIVMRHPLTREETEKWVRHILVEDTMFVDVSTVEGIKNPEETSNDSDDIETNETEESNETTDNSGNTETEEPEETTEEEITEEETQELESEDSEIRGGITGFFISEETGKMSKNVYFLIGIVVVIFGLLIFIMKTRKGLTPPHLKSRMTVEQELQDAEKKLKEAQEEIKDIRSKRTDLDDAEKEYEKAKEKLEKIKNQRDVISEKVEKLTEDDQNYKDFQDERKLP